MHQFLDTILGKSKRCKFYAILHKFFWPMSDLLFVVSISNDVIAIAVIWNALQSLFKITELRKQFTLCYWTNFNVGLSISYFEIIDKLIIYEKICDFEINISNKKITLTSFKYRHVFRERCRVSQNNTCTYSRKHFTQQL